MTKNQTRPIPPHGHRRFMIHSNNKSCSELSRHYNDLCLVIITLILKKLWITSSIWELCRLGSHFWNAQTELSHFRYFRNIYQKYSSKIFENRNSSQFPRGHRRFVIHLNNKTCSDLSEQYNAVCLIFITPIVTKLWPKIKLVPFPHTVIDDLWYTQITKVVQNWAGITMIFVWSSLLWYWRSYE